MIIQLNLLHVSSNIVLFLGKIKYIKQKQTHLIGWLEQGFSVYPHFVLLIQRHPQTIHDYAGLYTHCLNPYKVITTQSPVVPKLMNISFQQCNQQL